MAADVLLINPSTSMNIENNEPLNLLSLGAYLRQHGIEPRIHDEIRPRETLEEALQGVRYAGVTANTCTYPRAVEIMRRIKALRPDIITMAGGVHPTTMPEKAIQDGFHIVVSGEGEKALVNILEQNIREGIVTGEYISNEEMYRPARDLVDMPFYTETKRRCPHDPNLDFAGWNMRMACFLGSRGCPFSCIFCHNIWRKSRMRYVPVDWVIEEIADLRARYGVRAVWFMDDHIFLNKKRSRELFERIIAERLDIVWASAARADSMDDDLLELAHASGCRRLAIGVESGSDRVLKRLDKSSSVEMNYQAIARCHKHGIKTMSAVMIGNPDETLEDIEATQQFLLKSKTDYAALSILTPFPGTVLWKECEDQGRIPKELDFSTFNYLKAPIQVTDHVSPRELEVLKRKILIRYYMQPRQLTALAMKCLRNPLSMYHKIVEYF